MQNLLLVKNGAIIEAVNRFSEEKGGTMQKTNTTSLIKPFSTEILIGDKVGACVDKMLSKTEEEFNTDGTIICPTAGTRSFCSDCTLSEQRPN